MKRPPTGRIGLENIYGMLSRISIWDDLAILRPFEESFLQRVPDESAPLKFLSDETLKVSLTATGP